jgi:peptide/nickel transport system permease protein
MRDYIIRRLLLVPPLLIGVTLVTFLLSHSVPADPVAAHLGQSAMMDPATVEAFKREWGLDRPLHEQYFAYLDNLRQGKLGKSLLSKRMVEEDLRQYLPNTIVLATAAMIVAVLAGVPLGIISAIKRNSPIDHLVRALSLIGVSMPVFWLALVSLFLFYYHLDWMPGPGMLSNSQVPPPTVTGVLLLDALLAGEWGVFGNALHHLVLPSLVLASFSLGLIARVTRSSMLETIGQDFIRTARAKGLVEHLVVLRHALSNALIPTVTVIGLAYGNQLGGAVLTETIFAWPGIGRYAYQAAASFDFPAIMGVTMLIAAIYIGVNLMVDILYGVLDPRIRVG